MRYFGERIAELEAKTEAAKKAKGIIAIERVLADNQSYGAQKNTDMELFIRLKTADMLSGAGDADSLSVLHSWLGHMLHVAISRATRLPRRAVAYQELRQNTSPMLCRGRRALRSCWLRLERIGKVGFAGREIEQFKRGIEEGVLLSKHASRKEMRAAFVYADKMAKIKNLKVKNVEFRH